MDTLHVMWCETKGWCVERWWSSTWCPELPVPPGADASCVDCHTGWKWWSATSESKRRSPDTDTSSSNSSSSTSKPMREIRADTLMPWHQFWRMRCNWQPNPRIHLAMSCERQHHRNAQRSWDTPVHSLLRLQRVFDRRWAHADEGWWHVEVQLLGGNVSAPAPVVLRTMRVWMQHGLASILAAHHMPRFEAAQIGLVFAVPRSPPLDGPRRAVQHGHAPEFPDASFVVGIQYVAATADAGEFTSSSVSRIDFVPATHVNWTGEPFSDDTKDTLEPKWEPHQEAIACGQRVSQRQGRTRITGRMVQLGDGTTTLCPAAWIPTWFLSGASTAVSAKSAKSAALNRRVSHTSSDASDVSVDDASDASDVDLVV